MQIDQVEREKRGRWIWFPVSNTKRISQGRPYSLHLLQRNDKSKWVGLRDRYETAAHNRKKRTPKSLFFFHLCVVCLALFYLFIFSYSSEEERERWSINQASTRQLKPGRLVAQQQAPLKMIVEYIFTPSARLKSVQVEHPLSVPLLLVQLFIPRIRGVRLCPVAVKMNSIDVWCIRRPIYRWQTSIEYLFCLVHYQHGYAKYRDDTLDAKVILRHGSHLMYWKINRYEVKKKK